MDRPENRIVVRFAPSPTGHLHVGGARTALFNYLFAKSRNGDFILRIEDTDKERSSDVMSDEIIQGLNWLGLKWDSGPVYQSQRIGLYRKYAERLLKKNLAYKCYCKKEEIEKRSRTGDTKVMYMYDRHCLNLSKDLKKKFVEEKTPYTVRFRVPEGMTSFKDRIHKKLEIDNREIEDFVLLRSNGQPTYQLCVVVDDIDLGITDIIRGDDHISNTFKQILLFQAFENKFPRYTHLPLVFGSDKKKLSKRHGEISLLEFKRKGYLPESLLTYFSQLSWIPGDVNDIFSMGELIKKFTLEKVSKNSPVFDYDKLKFLNSLAIRKMDPEKLAEIILDDFVDKKKFAGIERSRIIRLIELVKPRIKLIADFKDQFELYLTRNFLYIPGEIRDMDFNEKTVLHLSILSAAISDLETFNEENVEQITRMTAGKLGIKAKFLIHPSRYALLGVSVSPSIFDVFTFLGREESVQRINNFIDFMKKNVIPY